MRYLTSTIAAFTLASAVGVFGQEQQPPAQPPAREQAAPQEPAAIKEQAAPKSTLTGCVVEAKTTDGGTVYVAEQGRGREGDDVHACRTFRIGLLDKRQQED